MKHPIKEALKTHFLRYRKMTPQDTVKLIYQSEFGPGHLITDEKYVRARLIAELEDTARDESIPSVELIGGEACRINLASLPTGLSADTLFRIFVMSASMFSGSERSFESKLYEVYSLIEEKYAPFSRYEYSEYIKKYMTEGGGAVRHSLYYNALYRPAYRVIHVSFLPLLPLLAEIDRLIAAGDASFTVKIDGRCGSGKTTLASMLQSIYGCGVVHADDFYPVRGTRAPLDFERLNLEVRDLISGKADSYGAFDCSVQAVTHRVAASREPFLIVEGSYSLHPNVRFGDISVFVTVDGEEQLRRIEKRSPDKLDAFRTRWIPAEEAYFAEHGTAENCDFVIDTNKFS